MKKAEKKHKENRAEIINLRQNRDQLIINNEDLTQTNVCFIKERNITQRKRGDETKQNATKRLTINETHRGIPTESNEIWEEFEERFQEHMFSRTPNPYINDTARSVNNSRAISPTYLRPPPFTGGLENQVGKSNAQCNENRNSKLN
jgi:hypothetical protein